MLCSLEEQRRAQIKAERDHTMWLVLLERCIGILQTFWLNAAWEQAQVIHCLFVHAEQHFLLILFGLSIGLQLIRTEVQIKILLCKGSRGQSSRGNLTWWWGKIKEQKFCLINMQLHSSWFGLAWQQCDLLWLQVPECACLMIWSRAAFASSALFFYSLDVDRWKIFPRSLHKLKKKEKMWFLFTVFLSLSFRDLSV